jgi:hypothetical protein
VTICPSGMPVEDFRRKLQATDQGVVLLALWQLNLDPVMQRRRGADELKMLLEEELRRRP